MTDFDDDFDDTSDESSDTGLKALRAAAKDGKKAKADADAARADADAARREIAFLKAGIDPESKTARNIAKVHEGEWSADALKATAAEFGWDQPESAPKVDPQELRAMDQFAAASTGGETTHTTQEAFLEALDEATSNWHNPNVDSQKAVLDLLKKQGFVFDDNRAYKPVPGGARGPVIVPIR